MRQLCGPVVLAAALVLSSPSAAQTVGQFTGAQPLNVNGHLAGVYVQSSKNVLSLLGQLRLSFYPGVDFGFLGGFARQDFRSDHRTTLRLGTDLKYQVVQASEGQPYSVSIGGALGVETGDHFSVLSLGPMASASRTFRTGNGTNLVPFVGGGMLYSNVNVDPLDDTDVSFPLRVGTEAQFNQQFNLTGELQFRLSDNFNDDVGFSVGVNMPF